MRPVYIEGVGLTPFGRLPGEDSLALMAKAGALALSDAGLERAQIDGLVTGYSTVMPHLMLSTLFAEYFGLTPSWAGALQLGGATGAAMVMLARSLVGSGQCERVLVVAGENRLSFEGGRDQAIRTLAQVGHARQEVPFGATIPGYYGLLASHYLATSGATPDDLAAFALHMRSEAASTAGAHLQSPLSLDDVRRSRVIADPLRLADCCPISDGAAALVISAQPGPHGALALTGAGQAHRHQHVSAADLGATGAGEAAARALQMAGLSPDQIGLLGIYDSFTVTAAILMEEAGFCAPGTSGRQVAEGAFARDLRPLNSHGGLLSYGHCGVAGGMAHLVEMTRQMQRRAGPRQSAAPCRTGYLHADGGVLSAHVGLVLEV